MGYQGQMVNLVLQELLELLALLVIEEQQDSLDQPVLLDQQVIEDLQDHREAKGLPELLEIQVLLEPLDFRDHRVALDQRVHLVLMET